MELVTAICVVTHIEWDQKKQEKKAEVHYLSMSQYTAHTRP